MWESHYWFFSITFNSASALRISILLFNNLKNLIIFFKIKPSLENYNIIPGIKISISKNTESFDITKVSEHADTINNLNLYSGNFNVINHWRRKNCQHQLLVFFNGIRSEDRILKLNFIIFIFYFFLNLHLSQ